MPKQTYRKSDIVIRHYDRHSRPVVNVKVYASPTDAQAAQVAADNGSDTPTDEPFTLAWIEAHLSEDERFEWWNSALSDAWEQLQNDIEGTFPHKMTVASYGRSSGWAGIEEFTSETVEGWSAIDVARWRKFARFARETADDVPYQYLSLIYLNVYQPAQERRALQPNASRWLDNNVQFPRLLREIATVGLSRAQYQRIERNSGLTRAQVIELFERATVQA